MIFEKIFELTRNGYQVMFLPYEPFGSHVIAIGLRKEQANTRRIMDKEEFTEGRILICLNKLENEIERILGKNNDQN